jgi:hypothetical protein
VRSDIPKKTDNHSPSWLYPKNLRYEDRKAFGMLDFEFFGRKPFNVFIKELLKDSYRTLKNCRIGQPHPTVFCKWDPGKAEKRRAVKKAAGTNTKKTEMPTQPKFCLRWINCLCTCCTCSEEAEVVVEQAQSSRSAPGDPHRNRPTNPPPAPTAGTQSRSHSAQLARSQPSQASASKRYGSAAIAQPPDELHPALRESPDKNASNAETSGQLNDVISSAVMEAILRLRSQEQQSTKSTQARKLVRNRTISKKQSQTLKDADRRPRSPSSKTVNRSSLHDGANEHKIASDSRSTSSSYHSHSNLSDVSLSPDTNFLTSLDEEHTDMVPPIPPRSNQRHRIIKRPVRRRKPSRPPPSSRKRKMNITNPTVLEKIQEYPSREHSLFDHNIMEEVEEPVGEDSGSDSEKGDAITRARTDSPIGERVGSTYPKTRTAPAFYQPSRRRLGDRLPMTEDPNSDGISPKSSRSAVRRIVSRTSNERAESLRVNVGSRESNHEADAVRWGDEPSHGDEDGICGNADGNKHKGSREGWKKTWANGIRVLGRHAVRPSGALRYFGGVE